MQAYFRRSLWPYLLLLPQIAVTLVFFIWPTLNALKGSFLAGDAFGLHSHFVGLANFKDLFSSYFYVHSFFVTAVFSFFVTALALSSALFMALAVNRIVWGKQGYRSFLIWPYAVAPAVAGILWRFLFDPSIGILAYMMHAMGYQWNYLIHGQQALLLVIIAAAWQQFSYNFIFFLAGLQAIPQSLLEAAAIDGAGPWRRFCSIIFPLLSPTTFFLLAINLIYAFFGTFGVIQTVTQGGPYNATDILVYKVYYDGFYGLDFGSSAAQSVILLLIVILLTVIQFRYIERKVHY